MQHENIAIAKFNIHSWLNDILKNNVEVIEHFEVYHETKTGRLTYKIYYDNKKARVAKEQFGGICFYIKPDNIKKVIVEEI